MAVASEKTLELAPAADKLDLKGQALLAMVRICERVGHSGTAEGISVCYEMTPAHTHPLLVLYPTSN